jgi:tetratricopeptide (TPR) repeat protein
MISMTSRALLAAGAIALGAWTAKAQTARPQPVSAQLPGRESLKRATLPSALLPVCSAGRSAAAPNDAQRRQARDLASRAQQAAILGDTAAALTNLRSARILDPSDPDLAYQLARIYESGAASDSAVKEYCRVLALAPNSPDAADARDRLSVLAKPASDPSIDAANTLFQQGIAAYEAGRLTDADARFSRALETQPSWADAYFDRALTRVAQGNRDAAASDFEVYMRLKPTAPDRASVATQVASLRRAPLSPSQALTLGLFIPGAGQFYTHRPGWGTALLVATGGAVAFALVPQTKTITEQQSATDPFGNPYTFTATRRVTEHPGLVAGLIAAGAIDLMGATEAAIFARRANNEPLRRVSLMVLPTQGALGFRVGF